MLSNPNNLHRFLITNEQHKLMSCQYRHGSTMICTWQNPYRHVNLFKSAIHTRCANVMYIHVVYIHVMYIHVAYIHVVYKHVAYIHVVYKHVAYMHVVYKHVAYMHVVYTHVAYMHVVYKLVVYMHVVYKLVVYMHVVYKHVAYMHKHLFCRLAPSAKIHYKTLHCQKTCRHHLGRPSSVHQRAK